MNSRVIFFVSAVAAGALAAYLGAFRSGKPGEIPPPTPPVSQAEQTPKQVQDWVRTPRPSVSSPAIAAAVADSVPAPCRGEWERVDALDLQKFLEGTETFADPDKVSKACAGLPPTFRAANLLLEKSCGKNTQEGTPEAQRRGCYQALAIYRATKADFLTAELTADKINDPRLLSDKLIAGLGKDPAQALPFAERLLELEPNFAPAAKMAAALHMATLSEGGAPDKALAAIERAERLEADPGLYNALRTSVSMASTADGHERLEMAKKLAQEQAGTPSGSYLSSYAAFKEGNFGEAARSLSDAIRADPQNPDYLETQHLMQELMRKGEKNLSEKAIYSGSFSMDPTKLIP